MPVGGSKKFIYGIFISAWLFFAIIIFVPAVYVLGNFSGFGMFANPAAAGAIKASFAIGSTVTCLNLVFGIPLAWILTRSKNKFVKWIDNLVDLSLVMPTAALGFSIYLYWGTRYGPAGLLGLENGYFGRGMVMIILLHMVFTLPYMVRSVSAAVAQINISYEEAARTLGANTFTFFRTIALPLFKDGVINGSVLSFTRSLSETGATMIVAGAFTTAPVLIIDLKNQGDLPAAAGVSIFLMISALTVLLAAKLLAGRSKVGLGPVLPKIEKSISKLTTAKNVIIFLYFTVFIFLPTIQIGFYSLFNFSSPGLLLLTRSLMLSLGLALTVTVVNLVFSVPFAYLIARNLLGLGMAADSMSEAVLLLPTSALGLSLALFWKRFIPSDLLVLALAHMSFTFPLLVKPLASAFRDISPDQEEAALSLGANARQMFTSVLLPQIKPAIIAGSIMAFMRSLSETGATMAVTGKVKTVSILIVDLFNSGNLAEAAVVCSILFVIVILLLYILKRTGKEANGPV